MQNGEFVGFIDINKIMSWSHLVLTYENKKATVYLNGQNIWEKEIMLIKTVKRIGNSETKQEQFYPFCDFRIYRYALNPQQVKQISVYDESKIENDYPDKLFQHMLPNNKINGILNILNAINSAVLPEAQEYLCKLVAFLATKKSTRMEIICQNGLQQLFKIQTFKTKEVYIALNQALANLK
eukprot:TRINITY_DN42672_c0_g1_i1.p1 TRINITY_DN42672_c0_g1~~TRINITY_DN42672_c0_g1_i1.p1  ORF type:complete len:182 (-),score=31.56 TRINITY_DN42672_c0_g1_i1:14-559(-)